MHVKPCSRRRLRHSNRHPWPVLAFPLTILASLAVISLAFAAVLPAFRSMSPQSAATAEHGVLSGGTPEHSWPGHQGPAGHDLPGGRANHPFAGDTKTFHLLLVHGWTPKCQGTLWRQHALWPHASCISQVVHVWCVPIGTCFLQQCMLAMCYVPFMIPHNRAAGNSTMKSKVHSNLHS